MSKLQYITPAVKFAIFGSLSIFVAAANALQPPRRGLGPDEEVQRAVITIRNDTKDKTFAYQYRWGRVGPWSSVTPMRPRSHQNFFHNLDRNGQAPNLEIRKIRVNGAPPLLGDHEEADFVLGWKRAAEIGPDAGARYSIILFSETSISITDTDRARRDGLIDP